MLVNEDVLSEMSEGLDHRRRPSDAHLQSLGKVELHRSWSSGRAGNGPAVFPPDISAQETVCFPERYEEDFTLKISIMW